jgi:hypothetical protein
MYINIYISLVALVVGVALAQGLVGLIPESALIVRSVIFNLKHETDQIEGF